MELDHRLRRDGRTLGSWFRYETQIEVDTSRRPLLCRVAAGKPKHDVPQLADHVECLPRDNGTVLVDGGVADLADEVHLGADGTGQGFERGLIHEPVEVGLVGLNERLINSV